MYIMSLKRVVLPEGMGREVGRDGDGVMGGRSRLWWRDLRCCSFTTVVALKFVARSWRKRPWKNRVRGVAK